MSDIEKKDSAVSEDSLEYAAEINSETQAEGTIDSDAQGEDLSQYFNPAEVDAIGEIGNICMGTSATTMYTLLNRKVTITTPTVELFRAENILNSYKCPFVAVSVGFVEGLVGKNLFIVKDYDAKLITDLLMGGEGDVDNDVELGELHFSAMSEVMNQMMGSAATAMSNMLGKPINISPPQVSRIEYYESVAKFLDSEVSTPVVKVSFDMEIEGLLKSKLLQIMTMDMTKELISLLMSPEPDVENAKMETKTMQSTISSSPAPAAPPAPPAPPVMPRQAEPVHAEQKIKSVKQPQYQSFDEPVMSPAASFSGANTNQSNFDLINDIPLQVTVELGKAKKNLNDVLNLGIGTIVVLDKQAGDLVEVVVNGKKFAKGEVVVIDENYGVRITEIIKA